MRDKKNDEARIGLMKEEIANIEEFIKKHILWKNLSQIKSSVMQ